MRELSVEDLDEIKQKVKSREESKQGKIIVHMGTCGRAAGAEEIMDALEEEFDKRDIDNIVLTNSGCAGLCSREPMVTIKMGDETPVKYVDLTPDKIKEILSDHVLGGNPVEQYALARGSEKVY